VTQVAGPLVVSSLARRPDGFSTALLIAFAALAASVAGLLIPLRER
jgi:hypothetical protein